LEQLIKHGLEGLPDLVRALVNEAMQIERENYLEAKPYERTETRKGYANGYKPKTVNTRVGKVTFSQSHKFVRGISIPKLWKRAIEVSVP